MLLESILNEKLCKKICIVQQNLKRKYLANIVRKNIKI
jgi:hypothetical protein